MADDVEYSKHQRVRLRDIGRDERWLQERIDEDPSILGLGELMEIKFQYPTGESETMLSVPHYSYLWQTIYYEQNPLVIPKGTRVNVVAHWDNSPNNPLNPDPTATIRWGDQSWDEMLVPFVGVLVDRDTDPRNVMARATPPAPVNAAP